jgi:hypothetical protein
VEEIEGGGGEIAGNEDDGIGLAEPEGEGKADVAQEKTACYVAEPVEGVIKLEIGQKGDQNGDKIENEDGTVEGARAFLRAGTLVRGIERGSVVLLEIGMIDDGAAEGALFFGVGKLDAAIYAKHREVPFIFDCFPP